MSSSNELIPLFPSATHPAIPISVQILSTLRHLTAPGKGNDLKAEERAALVGVAALLGCERIQSKDLPLSSAQKASSVSPAHFRSTLTRCRQLLESVPSPSTSPQRSPSKRERAAGALPSAAAAAEGDGMDDIDSGASSTLAAASAADVLNPLSTPKKKYKFSSGVDVSSLIRTPRTPRTHEPSIASPLRQSVTRIPSTRQHPGPGTTTRPRKAEDTADELDTINDDLNEGAEDADAEADPEGTELGTPTKKVRYSNPVGIDLEHPPTSVSASARKAPSASARKKREDASSFFALRPGSSASASGTASAGVLAGTNTDADADARAAEEEWMHRLPRSQHPSQGRDRRVARVGNKNEKEKERRRKVDWTYTEGVWGSGNTAKMEEYDKIWVTVWADLPEWLEKRSRSEIKITQLRGGDVMEILMTTLSPRGPDEPIVLDFSFLNQM